MDRNTSPESGFEMTLFPTTMTLLSILSKINISPYNYYLINSQVHGLQCLLPVELWGVIIRETCHLLQCVEQKKRMCWDRISCRSGEICCQCQGEDSSQSRGYYLSLCARRPKEWIINVCGAASSHMVRQLTFSIFLSQLTLNCQFRLPFTETLTYFKRQFSASVVTKPLNLSCWRAVLRSPAICECSLSIGWKDRDKYNG